MYNVILVLILSLLPLPAMAKSIVVMGDSVSAAYGMEVQQGWVALLQKKLGEQQADYIINNESISGDTSAGGLARVDQALSRHKPDWLLLELGGNDGLRGSSVTEMKNNLAEIVRRAQKAGARVLLLAMRLPPNYGKRYIDSFYDVYPQLSSEMNIPFVPFILEDVALHPELVQADGLHPNAKAQPVIAERIWKYLLPLLK